jgi:hypothetical protein
MAQDVKTKKAGNGYPSEVVENLVRSHEQLDEACATIMSKAMTDCKVHRQDQKDLLDEAKDTHGIPKGAMKKVLAIRKMERKAAKIREDAEDDVQDDIDQLRHSLGDLDETPLGEAAVEKLAA